MGPRRAAGRSPPRRRRVVGGPGVGYPDGVDWSDSTTWIVLGLLGNAAFFSRFLIQWIASERARDSVIPKAFWHLSLIGTVLLLGYAIHRRDPIFILAYLPNAVVYIRNLVLIRRKARGEGGVADLRGDAAADVLRFRP